jgi:DNA-directed RNA polymerase subunit RPC12/RpoP
MKSEKEVRDKLAELDGEYIPEERGGKRAVGEAKALKWILDDDRIQINSTGALLEINGLGDCPYCGSVNIESGKVQRHPDEPPVQKARCEDCGKEIL